MENGDKQQFHVRVDRSLYARIKGHAKRTERTVQGSIVHLLKKGLAAEERTDDVDSGSSR